MLHLVLSPRCWQSCRGFFSVQPPGRVAPFGLSCKSFHQRRRTFSQDRCWSSSIDKENPWKSFDCLRSGEPKFALDEKSLTKEYRRQAFAFHPDHNDNSDEAGELSASLRQAYEGLLNPISRAMLLCKVKYNFEVTSEDTNIDDVEFMSGVLDAYEFVSTIEHETPDTVKEFRKVWSETLRQLLKSIEDKFGELEAKPIVGEGVDKKLKEIADCLHKCTVISKLLTQCGENAVDAGIDIS